MELIRYISNDEVRELPISNKQVIRALVSKFNKEFGIDKIVLTSMFDEFEKRDLLHQVYVSYSKDVKAYYRGFIHAEENGWRDHEKQLCKQNT